MPKARKPNEESDDKKYENAKPVAKDEQEDFFCGKSQRLSENVSARRRTYSTSILNTSSLILANTKVIAAVEHAAVVIKKFSEAGI